MARRRIQATGFPMGAAFDARVERRGDRFRLMASIAAVCTFVRASDRSPPTASATGTPARLWQSLPQPGFPPNQSLLSLLGPTIHCRGRTCTC